MPRAERGDHGAPPATAVTNPTNFKSRFVPSAEEPCRKVRDP